MSSRLSLHCVPRPSGWLLTVAATLLGLLIGAGLGQTAPVPDPVKKDDPRKDDPKKDDLKKDDFPGLPNIEEILKNVPPGTDPDQIKAMRLHMERMREQMKKNMEEMRKQFPGAVPGGGFPAGPAFPGGGLPGRGFGGAVPGGGGFGGVAPFGRPGMEQEARLGARIEKPSATLVEQLDLPRNQGMVVDDVKADSAAAKAGLKANDILLELNGKPVSSDPAQFAKALQDIKVNTPVDAVVLRKGKKETVKGLSLPEAKEVEAPFPIPNFGPVALPGGLPAFPGGLPGAGGFPGGGLPGGFPGGGGLPGAAATSTTLQRVNDQFTLRHQDGDLAITVTGKIDAGKAKASEIQIREGVAAASKYESLDKVPEQYRAKVKGLIEASEKPEIKIEFPRP